MKSEILVITGGTGSFGNAVVKKLIHHYDEIRIFSRDEKKQDDMRKNYSSSKLKFFLGDVRDKSSLYNVLRGADYVFHAAALKQVPSCEFFPLEAVKTNVLGTSNVLDVCEELNVKKVVCLSTDKAAYPINAMGMSKALMEKVVQAKAKSSAGTVFCLTRYGNVMGSRGSVIPLFLQLIKSGRQLTLTDPNMTRYFMSLDDAVDLVEFAFNNAQSGDLFVQKAPAATIQQLADVLTEYYESNAGQCIIGTRHGEKLYETLCTKEELTKAEDLGDFYRIPSDARDLNYTKFFEEGSEQILTDDYNSHNARRLSNAELIAIIKKAGLL